MCSRSAQPMERQGLFGLISATSFPYPPLSGARYDVCRGAVVCRAVRHGYRRDEEETASLLSN